MTTLIGTATTHRTLERTTLLGTNQALSSTSGDISYLLQKTEMFVKLLLQMHLAMLFLAMMTAVVLATINFHGLKWMMTLKTPLQHLRIIELVLTQPPTQEHWRGW